MTSYPKEYYSLYKKIVDYRALGISIAEHYSEQAMRCPVHLSIGQEFWLPLISIFFKKNDRCFGSHRSHSMYMALEGNTKKLIAELHGHPDGALGGIGGSMHLKDLGIGLEQSNPIVGSSLGMAIGSAFASKQLNQNLLTLAYFGDGACEEGIIHESLNLASVLDLPILFICENNNYSCNTRIERRQTSNIMRRLAHVHSIKSASCSYSDSYKKLYETFEYAFTLARKNPFFLEIDSYRLYEHCGHKVDRCKGDRNTEEYHYYADNDVFKLINKAYPELQSLYIQKKNHYGDIIEYYQKINNLELQK